MTVQDDRMWADVLDAHTPNAAEMAAAEAELQALGEVAPLPAADVEALVELAVKTPLVVVEGRGVVGSVARSRRFQKQMLRAAAAVLVLMAVAAVVLKATQAKQRQYGEVTNYAKAVLLATEPGRTDADRLLALGEIIDNAGQAAEKLGYLANQAADPLSERAKKVSTELIALLTNGPSAPPEDIDGSLIESANTAADTHLAADVRREALDLVKKLAKNGLAAMWLAPLEGDEAKEKRDAWIARLIRALPR